MPEAQAPPPPAPVHRHRELSDEDLDRASIEELRAAYRSLREHHVAETTALLSRRDDVTRRRDEIHAETQKLLERAEAIMRSDEETIDRLGADNARLSEIIDFMRNHYSPLGGRGCALCIYEEGRFLRPCALHRWDDDLEKIRHAEDIAFARVDEQMQQVLGCTACERQPGQLCDLHAQLTLRWIAARDALFDRARSIGAELP